VFIAAARVAHDLSTHTFGCHDSHPGGLLTCAGFLAVAAEHNLSVRVAVDVPRPPEIDTGGRPLYRSYRDMAVANHVSPDHEELALCRDNHSLTGTLIAQQPVADAPNVVPGSSPM
jgi:hypothetical protein